AGPFAQDSGTGRCSSAIVAVGLAVAAAYGVILERARFGAWLALSAGIGGTASLARNVRAVLGLAASVARPAATGLFFRTGALGTGPAAIRADTRVTAVVPFVAVGAGAALGGRAALDAVERPLVAGTAPALHHRTATRFYAF